MTALLGAHALWVRLPLSALQRVVCNRAWAANRAVSTDAWIIRAWRTWQALDCQPAASLCADEMLIWGWRIPFLLAFLTALLGAQREGGGALLAEDNGRGRSCIHVRHVVPMPLGKTQQHAAHA